MQQQKTNLQADNKLAKEYQGDMDSKFKCTKNKLILIGKEKGTGHCDECGQPMMSSKSLLQRHFNIHHSDQTGKNLKQPKWLGWR